MNSVLFFRQETINALAWATCRAFKYRPSDPLHYLAYQLSRWRHGNASYNFYETVHLPK